MDVLFIHHSVGENWLNAGLRQALLAKPYIREVNDIYYGSDLPPDPGRPDSLQPLPGDFTDMDAWIFWFNDYLGGLKQYQNPGGLARWMAPLERKVTARAPQMARYFNRLKARPGTAGQNRIIMFKSCFPNSHLEPDGPPPGSPFSRERTIANNQAIFQQVDDYTFQGTNYRALEQIFADNPDTLFIIITSPPLHYAPTDATGDENARRARQFNHWLKTDWLARYQAAHPGLNNVAVFDLFDLLAYPDTHPEHPNRLRADYGGETGDSHPNAAANAAATAAFAGTAGDGFIDRAWAAFAQTGK
ncbi:MAG: hypothetical protein D6784_16665 [Chloroflexi bacterium]|nr:MAG: hypothetical protein D6784_16665 [Chloroflexota bacterium]